MNDDDPEYSVDSARAAADRGQLAEWVTEFLASPGSDNEELAVGLPKELPQWAGPVRLPLHRIHRLAGPADHPVLCPVDEDDWDDRVDNMADRIEDDDWEPAPLIVSYRDGDVVLEDGNHRVESLRRAGRDAAWAVVGFKAGPVPSWARSENSSPSTGSPGS